MIGRNKKWYVMAALMLFISIFFIQSASACLFSIDSPEYDRTYPYSINLPLEYDYNATDCAACYYNLYYNDTGFDYGNTTIECNGEYAFDVDADGEYTITLYATTIAPATEQNTSFFNVDRSEFEDSKPYASFLSVGLLLIIAMFVFAMGRSFSDEHAPIKIFFVFIPIIMVILSLQQAFLIAREYIKVPAISDTLQAFNNVYFWAILFAFMAYFFIYMTVKALQMYKLKKGGDDDFD